MDALYKADINSDSGLHPLLDSLQRYVPLVSKPIIQVLGHFLCLQVVPKKLSTESSGQCWNTRFLDYFGPSRLSWGGWTTLAKKNGISQHCQQNSVATFFGITCILLWSLVLSEDNEMIKVVD